VFPSIDAQASGERISEQEELNRLPSVRFPPDAICIGRGLAEGLADPTPRDRRLMSKQHEGPAERVRTRRGAAGDREEAASPPIWA